jgi:methylaspartate ammonia-lyase
MFNTTGPCVPEDHYMLPVLPRLTDVDGMISDKFYFIIHAARQSGKTTFLNFLTDKINSGGQMYALNYSLAPLRDIRDNIEDMNKIISQLNEALLDSDVEFLNQKAESYDSLPGMSGTGRKVKRFLNHCM